MKPTEISFLSTKQTEELIRTDLTPEQLAAKKDFVTKNLFKQFDLEEELKTIKDDFKRRLDILKTETREELRHVRNGFLDERMTVYNVPDDEKLIVEFFTLDGTRVGERRMTPDERPTIQFNPMRKEENN